MCGISGTLYKSDFNLGIEITIEDMEICLSEIKKKKASIDILLDKAWQYKSNINFLRYYTDEHERNRLSSFSQILTDYSVLVLEKTKHIDKNENPQLFVETYSKYEKLLDVVWFLNEENKKIMEGIKILSSNEEISQSSIIFYKSLHTILSSMDNRLEIRGRDSLGLTIQMKLFDEVSFDVPSYSKEFLEDIIIENISQGTIVTFTFKTANRVGSLGDNCKHIISSMIDNYPFNDLIRNQNIESATIVSHTRWASVGDVSISNCHPISNIGKNSENLEYGSIFSSLNGDIHNYKQLIENSDIKLSNIDEKCTTDCLSIPYHLTNYNLSSTNKLIEAFNQFQGSYAIAIQNSFNPERIILSSKGSQGLYIGASNDSIMFASDVYGLVESCRYFKSIKSGSLLSLNINDKPYGNNLKIDIFSLNDKTSKQLIEADFQTTNITTRDIDQRGFGHFLLKEIYETGDIVERTILGYLQSEELTNKDNFVDAIICDESQVPEKIIDKIVNKKINKIVITGMGTCYTAAVAISGYMRTLLSSFIPNISVEPHIASEGSGFYLNTNMQDTLVVVIAQSGTTVDTNVYVQMAKDRGASSIAIANKREGDVTFIVEGTLYIGSGRDIEIAVPSTKTYTAQVILGYILSLYLACRLNHRGRKNSFIKQNIDTLRKVPSLIGETFTMLEDLEHNPVLPKFPLTTKSWYMAFDNSPNSVCAMEIRIKYSEGCYHSLPYLHIDDLIDFGVKDSFITYITDSKISDIKSHIDTLSQHNNILVITSELKTAFESNNLEFNANTNFIFIPNVDPNYSFIPTTIAGQLISYYIAVELDNRKKIFLELLSKIKSNESSTDIWDKFLNQISLGNYEQGFTSFQLNSLIKCYNSYLLDKTSKKELEDELESLYEFARRPIDTIKHQAKTLTVGAVRQVHDNLDKFDIFNSDSKDLIYDSGALKVAKRIENYIDEITYSKTNMFGDVNLVYPNNIDESYGYYMVNIMNNLCNTLKLDKSFHLAHHYDLDRITAQDNRNWIILSNNSNEEANKLKIFADISNIQYYNLSDTANFFPPGKSDNFDFSIKTSLSISKLSLSFIDDRELFDEHKNLLKKNFEGVLDAFVYINTSDEITSQLDKSLKYISQKNNLKILGSGVNYNSAKLASKILSKTTGRSCAFDVLENHKHIDISAEAACIILIHNIWRQGYQNDVVPEIEKLVSHDNIPIVLTNEGDNRFDTMEMKVTWKKNATEIINVPVIKLPKVDEDFAFLINNAFFDNFINKIKK